jgi:Transposase DDE domain
MFVREKNVNGYTYLVLVESVREGGRTKQRIIKNLGRKESVLANGDLERLAASIGRFAERALVIAAAAGTDHELTCRRIGGPLLFGRLWERLGIEDVLIAQLAERAFEFPLERAVFVSVLHRLFVSGSDRDCAAWLQDYVIPGAAGLALHHFYRAMAWLGEELDEASQRHRTLAPRCIKDEIEEALFARRRDLFSDLSVVFMDTTSLSFAGAGGVTLGARGHSKDHRPDLKQMILGLVVDAEGRPVCTEMWPGNTADVTVLLPIIDRLRGRFGIGRVCVVADRGLISAATIAGLEERGLEYILGVRERSDALVRKVVLADEAPFVPLFLERAAGETQLFVKEVTVAGRRYIVCRNEAEAEKDRSDRQAIVAGLEKQLARGDKALIGNSAYRRYLRKAPGRVFEIDAGKLAEEARFDGIFVLRTNANVTPLQAVLRYRDLLQVEDLFRRAKAVLATRPIYHSSDPT